MLEQGKCGRSQNEKYNSVGDCCIDTYRIYDSCRTQECPENLLVMVTDEGQPILDVASAIRIKSAKILWAGIQTEEMPFHKGYFQITTRFYIHTLLDCCTGLGTGQDVAGLCVFDKSVLLYGGESGVSVFQSDLSSDSFCGNVALPIHTSANKARAVVETAEPIALRLNVLPFEGCSNFGTCVCSVSGIPDHVANHYSGTFREASCGNKVCYLSLGIFSLVRIERPAQLIIPACDACIPSGSGEYDLPYTDPCSLFRSMDFPVEEFYPEIRPNVGTPHRSTPSKNCDGNSRSGT